MLMVRAHISLVWVLLLCPLGSAAEHAYLLAATHKVVETLSGTVGGTGRQKRGRSSEFPRLLDDLCAARRPLYVVTGSEAEASVVRRYLKEANCEQGRVGTTPLIVKKGEAPSTEALRRFKLRALRDHFGAAGSEAVYFDNDVRPKLSAGADEGLAAEFAKMRDTGPQKGASMSLQLGCLAINSVRKNIHRTRA